MASPVVGDTGGPVEPEPRGWVQGVDGAGGLCTWDIASDESFAVALERREAPQLRLVRNFFAELGRLVPAD
jgi:hypothetical protein